ncbi:serine hydrolase domain-containing protein [Streptacidiphilus sp. PAMC 29251]
MHHETAHIQQALDQLTERGVLLGAEVFHSLRGEVHRLTAGEAAPGLGPADTVGRLYCTNKPVLAVIVGIAAQRGLLDLRAPLSRYFDRCGTAMSSVTAADLLAHTVNLPPALHHSVKVLQERAGLTVATASRRPGRPQYNAQSGSVVIGALLERVYGLPLAGVIEEEVARPLGLRGLALTPRPDQFYRPLHRRGGSTRFVPLEDEALGLDEANPGQAGVSTAADMGVLYSDITRSLNGGGVLLKPSTARQLTSASHTVQLYHLGVRSWGMGFQCDLARGILGPGWGPRTFGHIGTTPRRVAVLHAADPDADRVLALRLFNPMDDGSVRRLTTVL